VYKLMGRLLLRSLSSSFWALVVRLSVLGSSGIYGVFGWASPSLVSRILLVEVGGDRPVCSLASWLVSVGCKAMGWQSMYERYMPFVIMSTSTLIRWPLWRSCILHVSSIFHRITYQLCSAISLILRAGVVCAPSLLKTNVGRTSIQ
jgi:hypothetical protein